MAENGQLIKLSVTVWFWSNQDFVVFVCCKNVTRSVIRPKIYTLNVARYERVSRALKFAPVAKWTLFKYWRLYVRQDGHGAFK